MPPLVGAVQLSDVVVPTFVAPFKGVVSEGQFGIVHTFVVNKTDVV